jgi:hypothetical protein
MKAIGSWEDLKPYGIVPLTVEPDGLCYRIVCDITAKGKTIIERALGITDIQLAANWDYGTNEEPHIGSMLLIPEYLLVLSAYVLFEDGCHEVWLTKNSGVIGIQHGDSQQIIYAYEQLYQLDMVRRFTCLESDGYRGPNVFGCVTH